MNPQLILAKLKAYPVLTGAIAALLIGVVLLVLRMPEVGRRDARFQALDADWKRMEVNQARAIGLADDVEEARQRRAELQERLIDPSQVAVNLGYFYGIERASGARLIAVQQGAVLPAKPPVHYPELKDFSMVTFTVSLEGGFHAVLDALARIETGRHLMRVDSWHLAPPAEQGVGGRTQTVGEVPRVVLRMELTALGRK
jgi:hypothetical protein